MAEVRKNTVHPLHIEGYTAEGMGVARLDGPGGLHSRDYPGGGLGGPAAQGEQGGGLGQRDTSDLPLPRSGRSRTPLQRAVRGCQYRHMSYEEELAAKGQRVRDALERVGGVHLELPPVLGAESPCATATRCSSLSPEESAGCPSAFTAPGAMTWWTRRTACSAGGGTGPASGLQGLDGGLSIPPM